MRVLSFSELWWSCLMASRISSLVQKAHVDGLACVISCPQEDAENYCEGLRGNGLISSIEPDN